MQMELIYKNSFSRKTVEAFKEKDAQVKKWVPIRVARFFFVQNTKTWKNIPNDHKIYLMAIKCFQ
jgi:hypothetical protein